MRIGYKKFREIKKWYGSSDFEIGHGRECITLRFGYWAKIKLDELQQVLPDYFEITENVVDDDNERGPLYNYIIKQAY